MKRVWLQELRLKRGLSQLALSEKLGLHKTSVSNIEAGKRQKNMDIELITALSKILNVSVNKIIQLETEYKNENNQH